MTASSKSSKASPIIQTQTASVTWDPIQQIYVGGGVPNHNEEAVDAFLKHQGPLRIFGYGSLCWSPGVGALSKDGVTTKLGRVIGYKRCWAQKSTDHRGVPSFPGIVCTLLTDDQVKLISSKRHMSTKASEKPSMTEGVIYTIPLEQVEACLAELDFREKGGYARDVVEVIEYESGQSVQALLYRGTPDNPAFWERAFLDFSFAAAVMSVAIGPSGRNDEYLFNLDRFMSDPMVATQFSDFFHGDTDTSLLANMVKSISRQKLFFLVGCGSNQHNQLLLKSDSNDACLSNNGEFATEMKEIVLCTNVGSGAVVKSIHAGGGNSALLTESGDLFLWGWNDDGQLGRSKSDDAPLQKFSLPIIPKLSISVEKVALGYSHTLVIEKDSGKLFAFGSNGRGQCGPSTSVNPTHVFPGDRFIDIAAGLFHSAAITDDGRLIAFGCDRFGQAPSNPWKPIDGASLVQVACGCRHTILLDDRGRVWTVGDNKYGQLGRSLTESRSNDCKSAQLVDGFLGKEGSGCFLVKSGWSHCVVATRKSSGVIELFGWGRNDKGQLGLGFAGDIFCPTPLAEEVASITSFSCGSESTIMIDVAGNVHGCGWNEHGNLGTGDDVDSKVVRMATGARICVPPSSDLQGEYLLASGGAHVIAMRMN